MNITINLLSLIATLSKEDKHQFYQQMSNEDAVIGHVVDQMMAGCTENGYEGSHRIGIDTWDKCYPYPIERARQYMVTHAEEATRESLSLLVDEYKRYRDGMTASNTQHDEIRELKQINANLRDRLFDFERWSKEKIAQLVNKIKSLEQSIPG